jgi:hypothetical protein
MRPGIAILVLVSFVATTGCARKNPPVLAQEPQQEQQKPSANPKVASDIGLKVKNVECLISPEEAIDHFLGLDYPVDLYRIVVITSARERLRGGRSTGDLVEQVVAARQGGRVLHFRADGSDACKADQMNQALQWLEMTSPSWWTVDAVLGVYDADSRPELHTLRDLDRVVREKATGARNTTEPSRSASYVMPRDTRNTRTCISPNTAKRPSVRRNQSSKNDSKSHLMTAKRLHSKEG